MKFVEVLGSELRHIPIAFVHELMEANGIQTVLDEDDAEHVLIWISEEVSEEVPEERKRRLRFLHSYKSSRIEGLFQGMERKCYYKNLPKALGRCKAWNDYERSLVSATREGLQFLSPKCGTMEYCYDPFYEEESEFHPMCLYQQIRVIYDSYNMVTDYLVNCYNSHSRETCDIVPVTTLALSLEVGELFHMDDYPKRSFEWANKFISIVV